MLFNTLSGSKSYLGYLGYDNKNGRKKVLNGSIMQLKMTEGNRVS